MNTSGRKQRVRRLEACAERHVTELEARVESGRCPITVEQLCGVKPITDDDNERLRAWMLEHGWREGKNGRLIEVRARR